tara:strand:- start:1082 stop:1837 length:756 start_codon:yes stop_codon:yes gene_type:complete
MNQKQNDEVGLIEFFEILWDGKGIISFFVFAALVTAAVYINTVKYEYESKIVYSVDVAPSFFSNKKTQIRDFTKAFFNQNLFDNWKKKNQNTILSYKDISENLLVENVLVDKPDKIRVVLLDEDDDIGAYILVRSNQFRLLDDIYNYAGYINEAITKEYILISKQEINIINKRSSEFSATTDIITSNLLSIDRYIMEAKNGANVFRIMRPTIPNQTWPKVNIILVVSFMFGLFLGVVYIFIADAIRFRKQK